MNAPVQFGKVVPRGNLVIGISRAVKIRLQLWSVIASAARMERLHVGLEAWLAPRILAETWMGT
jgi:hypothetical protein